MSKTVKMTDSVAEFNGEQPVATETKPEPKLNKYQVMSIVFASLLALVIVGFVIYGAVKNYRKPLEEVLTPENYAEIVVDMKYNDVVNLLGEGRRMGSEVNEVTYVWQSNNDKMIVVTFTGVKENGKLVPKVVKEKAQLNVIVEEE